MKPQLMLYEAESLVKVSIQDFCPDKGTHLTLYDMVLARFNLTVRSKFTVKPYVEVHSRVA